MIENLKEFVCKFVEKESKTSFPHLYIVGYSSIIQTKKRDPIERFNKL